MAIQKYQDSFADAGSLTFSTMLDRFFNDSLAARGRVNSFSPQADAYETDKNYQIDVALPGLRADDIKVDFQRGRLTISGERNFQNEQSQRRYHLVESAYGSFQRSFQLPDTIDASHIEAKLEDGVLCVTVPKDQQKAMRHQIQVKGGQPNQPNNQQATDVPVQSENQPSDQNSNQPDDQKDNQADDQPENAPLDRNHDHGEVPDDIANMTPAEKAAHSYS